MYIHRLLLKPALLSIGFLLLSCGDDPEANDASVDAPDVQTDGAQDASEDAPPDSNDAEVPDVGPCALFSSVVSLGNVASDLLDEISGVIYSSRNPGILYVHNDSGDEARLFAINMEGRVVAELQLIGATNRDFEDIAILRREGAGTIVLGDVGDNGARNGEVGHPSVQVYLIEEPVLETDQARVTLELSAEAITFEYPDRAADVEGIFVDPMDGSLYFLSKENSDPSRVYRAENFATRREGGVLEALGEIALPQVTGADIDESGERILLRSYVGVRLYPRSDGESVFEALGRGVGAQSTPEGQGESVAFVSLPSRGYITISEGIRPALNFFAERCDERP